MDNPFIGVGFHAVGGVAHGSFYVPFKRVQGWAWESAWLVQGFSAWIIMPWLAAGLTNSHPLLAFSQTPWSTLVLTFLFGAMWGAGSLTFGMSMRYLGMSLGMSVALGFTVSLGTLVPPLFAGHFDALVNNLGGFVVLLGIATCLGGIGLCGLAGIRRERECNVEPERVARKSLTLGFAMATFSGIMSAGFAFGIQVGAPIAQAAYANGAPAIFKNGPVFIIVMAGGFLINFLWCATLSLSNRSLGNLIDTRQNLPLGNNYFWASISGAIWYFGFMMYGMGTTFMGRYDFTSWSIHLAFVIVVSTICGIMAKEWFGVKPATAVMVGVALVVLISSTLVIALGNRMVPAPPPLSAVPADTR